MSHIHHRGPARIEANLTPMIDMTFLLVVFFVVVSTITEAESVEMKLPGPDPTASAAPTREPRMVVNVVPDERGEATGYRLNGIDYELDRRGLEALGMRLQALYEANPDLMINLRADRRTEQRHIAPVLESVTEAAGRAGKTTPARVNLVVVRERGGSSE